MIGCDCVVCQSDDPRDNRMRPSLLVTTSEGRFVIDTGPEMRLQMLRAGVDRIDAALITHAHADHIFGLDDLRQFNFRGAGTIPVHAEAETLDRLRSVFDYCFKETQVGGGKPRISLEPLFPLAPIEVAGIEVLPVRLWHGRLPVLGFVLDRRFAYCTDVSAIPDESREVLTGIDGLVLGAVRTSFPRHSTHFILPEALEEFVSLSPSRGWITHLSHFFNHASVEADLPQNIRLAYDGLTLDFPGQATPSDRMTR